MSPARPFDRFMVSSQVTRSRKMRAHFTPAERWAWMAVLCIASDAPVRGCLTIGDVPCTAKHLKDEADVPAATATSALRKFRELEMLVPFEERDCERVRDWSDYNPEPRADETNAERQRRFRKRKREELDEALGGHPGECQACGATEDLQYDHIFPRAFGGQDDPSNIQILCGGCNRLKGTRIVTLETLRNEKLNPRQPLHNAMEVGRTKKEEQQLSSEPNPVLGAVVAGRASITNNIEAIA